jgi:hypothetical protein
MIRPTKLFHRSALAIALAAAFAGSIHAQSTTGSIIGQAPALAGETVLIEGSNGITRELPVDSQGRYSAASLPLATYTVSLRVDGKTVETRNDVTLRVGLATDVSFKAAEQASAANAKDLGVVKVSANALPPIDVTSTSSSLIVTSAEMARLPLQRTAEAVALLAPGAVAGSKYFSSQTGNSLVSFSGSSVTENAYYINGFNTTDPLSGFGGIELPYGAVDQEEVLSGGYSAAYGRSDGGVISQVGKRGTNDWHFGAQMLWQPAFAQESPKDIYYAKGADAGNIFQRYQNNKSWTTTADAYVGGPLIKDKLYMFAAVEAEKVRGNTDGSVNSPYDTKYTYENPKWYAKLDWNINDSNILELTGVSQKHQYEGQKYQYDYGSDTDGAYNGTDGETNTSAKIYVAKFTSYITDDLTLTALYGKSKISYYSEPPSSGVVGPFLGNTDGENPELDGGHPITNHQTLDTAGDPDHRSTNRNLRLDLNYKIGSHNITAGIDNQDSQDIDDGSTIVGDGYEIWYAQGDASKNIGQSPFVGKPGDYPGGGTGYYAYIRHYNTLASVRVKQRAQYIEDSWQVSDSLLLDLGLRNDQFTNYNPEGQAYLRLSKPQWAPRLGFSWDVNGDASLKVYGNAGRYFLAMPASVALRTAAGSLAVNQYFTYTGIDATGVPTGLTPIASETGGGVSPNGEYGQAPDPKTVSAKNIKSEYQDEYILGFDHQFDPAWVWGMKATVRKLRNALDDICDSNAVQDAATAQGIDVTNVKVGGCYLANPGRANVYQLAKTGGGYADVTVTNADYGFTHLVRNYYGLDTYLSHPFDGTWSAKIDYLYSHSYGNTEGQVRSDINQPSVSATRDWDYASLMEFANGVLPNDRKHQLKLYGSYQIAPEWMLSANITVLSGSPKSCLGMYGIDQTDPVDYGSFYHYCDGKPSRPGDKGRNPWQEIVTVSGEYRPEWAGKKLGFNVMVYNLFNQQRVDWVNPVYGSTKVVSLAYDEVEFYETPRYVRFGVTYDF